MADWGIKVVNAGTTVTSTDPRDMVLHSSFNMLKQHSMGTVSVTIAAGGTVAYGTISHNLGYVPAYIAYDTGVNGGTDWKYTPTVASGGDGDLYTFAYAGTANIVCGISVPVPWLRSTFDYSDYWDGYYSSNWSYTIGNRAGGGINSAMRFTGITLNKSESFSSAYIKAYVSSKGTASGDATFVTKGIDEDNTGDFSSDPMGRSQTDAAGTQSQNLAGTPFTFDIPVTGQLSEITSRAGWSNGNAAGFHFLNQSSPTDAWLYGNIAGSASQLIVQKSGSSLTAQFTVFVFKDKIST